MCSGPPELFSEENSGFPPNLQPVGFSSTLSCFIKNRPHKHVECVCKQARVHIRWIVSSWGRNLSFSLGIFWDDSENQRPGSCYLKCYLEPIHMMFLQIGEERSPWLPLQFEAIFLTPSCLTTSDSPAFRSMARDFPGGPVVKASYSQCRGSGFHPWSGN